MNTELKSYRITYKDEDGIRKGCIVGKFNDSKLGEETRRIRSESSCSVDIKVVEIGYDGAPLYRATEKKI